VHLSPLVYAEAGGFVLVDPARLTAVMQPAVGEDLLALFATTALGDEVARTGVMVPVLGVDPGWYDLLVHGDGDAPDALSALDGSGRFVQRSAHVRSGGWVLETETGELFLDPLAALQDWDPADPRHGRVQVAPGTYAVEVRAHLPREDQPGLDGIYSWVLRRTAARAWFTADVGPPGP
jgi:hypothetical protein